MTGATLQVAAPELLVLQIHLGVGFVKGEMLTAAPGVKGVAGCCHCVFGTPRV